MEKIKIVLDDATQRLMYTINISVKTFFSLQIPETRTSQLKKKNIFQE